MTILVLQSFLCVCVCVHAGACMYACLCVFLCVCQYHVFACDFLVDISSIFGIEISAAMM